MPGRLLHCVGRCWHDGGVSWLADGGKYGSEIFSADNGDESGKGSAREMQSQISQIEAIVTISIYLPQKSQNICHVSLNPPRIYHVLYTL